MPWWGFLIMLCINILCAVGAILITYASYKEDKDGYWLIGLFPSAYGVMFTIVSATLLICSLTIW